MTTSFQDGLALAAIVHRYRPDLVDFYSLTMLGQSCEAGDTNVPNTNSANIIQYVFDTLESDLGILPVLSGRELADTTRKPDKLTMMSYLSQIYEMFRREIPAAIGMGNCDPMSVTIDQGLTRFSDDDILSNGRNVDPTRQKYHRKGNMLNTGKQIPSIGQLVADDIKRSSGAKKRRSKENTTVNDENGSCLINNKGHNKISNKENIIETERLNRSANKKRLERLMNRAKERSGSVPENKYSRKGERKSIKDNEEFKEIERKFCGGGSHQKRRSSESSEFGVSSGPVKHYHYKSAYREQTNKRPKDLKRAIGKLEKEDWNVKSIEEKLLTKKEPTTSEKDKVPKWSKAAFQDKFNIMKGKLGAQSDSNDANNGKYSEVDATLAKIQIKLREGSALDVGTRGSNKVSTNLLLLI